MQSCVPRPDKRVSLPIWRDFLQADFWTTPPTVRTGGYKVRFARHPPRIVGKHSWNYLFALIIGEQ